MAKFNLSDSNDYSKGFLIKRSELLQRIDPIYYNSNIQKYLSGKYNSVKLSNVILKFKSGFGAGKQDQANGDEGIIQIRPTNIDSNGLLKFDKNIYLPYGTEAEMIDIDDVLFNNTNSQELVGKTTILKEKKRLFFSNHITKLVVDKSKLIPDFLWIILNLYQENKIFYSICTNWNNQSGVGLELLKSLKIPLPPKEIQQQIVEKINSAYTQKQQKEAQATALLASIDAYLLNELGITLPEKDTSLQSRIFTTSFSEVSGGRFDGYYYQKDFIEFFNCLKKGIYPIKSLKKISKKITSGITPLSGGDAYTNSLDGVPFIRSGNIDIDGDIDFEDLLYLKKEIHEVTMKSSKVEYNDLMIAIVGATIGQVGIYNDTREANINQAIALVRLKEEINHNYVKEVIKSSIGQYNLNRLKRPVARANINLEEISTMQIILPPKEKQDEIAAHIQNIRAQAKQLQEEAKMVLEEAKREVEKMIIG